MFVTAERPAYLPLLFKARLLNFGPTKGNVEMAGNPQDINFAVTLFSRHKMTLPKVLQGGRCTT